MSAGSGSLDELQRRFAEALPDKLENLRSQYQRLDPSDWEPSLAESLLHQLHSLTGSAGTFGLAAMSAASRELETRIKNIVEAGTPPGHEAW
ncbi:Hpt domain-containing protein, partial [Thioalkalivibrio sp.]